MGDYLVSIRSRLLGREIPLPEGFTVGGSLVSIRSRLLGREIPNVLLAMTAFFVFQSAPGFWAGRYGWPGLRRWCPRCFNPLPAFGPGDTTTL